MSNNGAMNTRPGAALLKPLSFKMFSVLFIVSIITKFIQLTGKQSDTIDTLGMVSYYVTALLGAMTIYYRVAPSTMTTSLTVIAMFAVLFFFQDLVDILVRKPKEKELARELADAESTSTTTTA
jgi:uncharacterized membrane protein HdeD (DUF308 family)